MCCSADALLTAVAQAVRGQPLLAYGGGGAAPTTPCGPRGAEIVRSRSVHVDNAATRLFPGTLVCQYMLGPCFCSTELCRTTRSHRNRSPRDLRSLQKRAGQLSPSVRHCTHLLWHCASPQRKHAAAQAGSTTRNTPPGRRPQHAVLASFFKEHQSHRRRDGGTGLR